MRPRRRRPVESHQGCAQGRTKVAFTLSDPSPGRGAAEEFLKLLPDLDIIFANEDEAKSLFEVESFYTVLEAARSTWHGIAALTRSEKAA